jgi:hypothetical protein
MDRYVRQQTDERFVETAARLLQMAARDELVDSQNQILEEFAEVVRRMIREEIAATLVTAGARGPEHGSDLGISIAPSPGISGEVAHLPGHVIDTPHGARFMCDHDRHATMFRLNTEQETHPETEVDLSHLVGSRITVVCTRDARGEWLCGASVVRK